MKRIGLLLLILALAGYFSGCGKKPRPVTEKPPVEQPKPKEEPKEEPVTEPTEEPRPGEISFVKIYFDFDKYNVRDDAKSGLERNARVLRDNRNVRIQIEGHCDERGTVEYNLALGERRAAAVKSFLVSQGIPAARIGTISYGKERPDPVGSDESAWSRQRRGQTTLSN